MPLKVRIVKQGPWWLTQFPPPLNRANDAHHISEEEAREHIADSLPGQIVEIEVQRADIEDRAAARS